MFTLRSRARGRRGDRHQRGIRLKVNSLESRLAPAQLVVTSSADDGSVGTLRSIVAIANSNGEADTITFDSAVTSITLVMGQLNISESKNLTIDGGGSVSIYGNTTPSSTNRILDITAKNQPSILLSGITLAKANVTQGSGAGIRLTDQVLTLINVTISDNTVSSSSDYYGGALSARTSAKLIAVNCQFSRNTALVNGGISIREAGQGPAGTALFDSCLINDNRDVGTAYSGGGLGIWGEMSVSIQKTAIRNNLSRFCGGLTFHGSNAASLVLFDSEISGNFAESTATGQAEAAGMHVTFTKLTMFNSTISRNQSANDLNIRVGGAVIEHCPEVTIANCTIAQNGTPNLTSVGGISFDGSPIWNVDSCIIADNHSKGHDDIRMWSMSILKVDNSIIGVKDTATYVIIGSNNIVGTATMPADPGLLPLGFYGGSTQTTPLKVDSIALNKGSNPLGLMFDQRGQPREVPTGFPDIGAFEGIVAPARVSTIQINDGSGQRSMVNSITVNFDLPVALPNNPANAFQLVRQSDSALVAMNASMVDNSVTLTFTGGPIDFGSLADGRYTLTVLAAQVTSGYFDGNADGVAGDNYVLVGNPTNGLFRLFGDADGNGAVTAVDFSVFRLAYGSAGSIFDFNNDGQTGTADFEQFRLRYGVVI